MKIMKIIRTKTDRYRFCILKILMKCLCRSYNDIEKEVDEAYKDIWPKHEMCEEKTRAVLMELVLKNRIIGNEQKK